MRIKIFIIVLCFAIVGLSLFTNIFSSDSKIDKVEFSFGIIADCQYCNFVGEGVRKYSLSNSKLEKCVNHFNTMNLKYSVHLGDFIDRNFESFDVVNPIYEKLNIPGYHVLGNHDFSVSDEKKNDVPKKMGLSSRYYDFEQNGWRFIVLDGNDISFHAYPSNSKNYEHASEYYVQNSVESPKWNGAIGTEQLAWLKNVLEKSTSEEEKVILYCHFPIYPENVHNLWNAEEIIKLLEQFSCVKAYINGHNHAGNYDVKQGIHYLTIKGMVDTEQSSYAIITVNDELIKVTGYGREENRLLEIRK
jgi:predicted phosphodiesterase